MSSNLTVRAMVPVAILAALPDDATLVRWLFFAIAGGAVVWGIWHFMRREPPRSRPTVFPVERR